MAGDMLTWRFFDVAAETLPDALSAEVFPLGGRGRIVALAATPFARNQGWAERAAVALARGWSAQGLRIFMMDLALEDPRLHEAVGVPNTEGVADAFLFGASIEHIARASPEGSFFFASAGTFPPDPAEVLSHPRWNDLAGGFSEALATLVLFLPTTVPGAEKILSRATDIVFLAGQGEAMEDHLGPAAIKVVAVAGPVGSPPLAPPGPFPGVAPGAPAAPRVPAFPPGDETTPPWERPAGEPHEQPSPGAFEAPAPAPMEEGFTSFFDTFPDWSAKGTAEAVPGSGPGAEEGVLAGGGFELSDDFLAPGPEPADGTGPVGQAREDGIPPPPESGPSGEALPDLEPWFGPEAGPFVLEGVEEGGGGPTSAPTPEFPSDFVELPPVPDDESGFGDLLVQGPDFGSPPAAPAGPQGAGADGAGPGGPPSGAESPGAGVSAPPYPRPPRGERQVVAERTPAPPPRRPPPAKKHRLPVAAVVAVALLAVAGTVAASVLGYLNLPALAFLQDAFGRLPEPALVAEGPQPTGPVLRYSLRLFDYREEQLEGAREILEILRSKLPAHLFHLTYAEGVGGRRVVVLAGPGTRPEEVEALRAPIGAVFPRENPAAWGVLETPRGFFLGKRSSLEEARTYLRSVEARGIPAYILSHTYDDGSSGFGIWAGAYAGVEDARPMQRALRRAGFGDVPLLERRGRVPE